MQFSENDYDVFRQGMFLTAHAAFQKSQKNGSFYFSFCHANGGQELRKLLQKNFVNKFGNFRKEMLSPCPVF